MIASVGSYSCFIGKLESAAMNGGKLNRPAEIARPISKDPAVANHDRGSLAFVRPRSIAPIEQVINPDRHHLNVATAGRERVRTDDGDRYRERIVAQPYVVVLQFGSPIISESPFYASTTHPTAVGVTVADGNGTASCHIGQSQIVAADPSTAALHINEQPVRSETYTTCQRRQPPAIITALHDRTAGGDRCPSARIVTIREPIEVTFDAEDDIAYLVIEPDLGTTNERGAVISTPSESPGTVGDIAVIPARAKIAAEIKSSPTKRGYRYEHRSLRRRRSWRKVCCLSR
jgi:hypothetical protein